MKGGLGKKKNKGVDFRPFFFYFFFIEKIKKSIKLATIVANFYYIKKGKNK